VLQLPAQVQAGAVEGEVVPADRSGVLVDFALREVRAAVVTLTTPKGWPLPLGSRVRLEGGGIAPQIVGYDGQVYLEHLTANNRLVVIMPEGDSCEAAFAYPPAAEGIPAIGPVSCRSLLP